MTLIQEDTAWTHAFWMVNDTDYVTAATGKTVSVQLSKAGGALAAASGTVSEIGSGLYKIALDTTDTNTAGELVILATATGCAPWRATLYVIADLNAYNTTDVAITLDDVNCNMIADYVWRRNTDDIEAASHSNLGAKGRYSPLGVLAKHVHKVTATGGTVTVYEQDGVTTLYTLTITTSASAYNATSQT